MGNKVLSVVIPAYNMEKYIKQTLDSLVCDEYMDKLEVLVIDDGSKDDTAAIAKTYEDRYPGTFRVISKENGGHGSALNKGIELATGKYYRPLDADDWVDTSALKAVIAEMEAHDADMVLTNFRKVYEKTQKTENVRISNVWNRKQIDEGKAVPKPGRKVLIYGQVYDLIRNYLIIQSSTFSTLYHTEHRFSKIIIYVLTSMYSMMIWNMTYSRFHMLRQFFRLTGIFTNTALKEKVRVLTSHHLPVTISTGVRL